MAIINAKQGRTYSIGGTIMSDETIMLDLNEGNGTFTCGNIPIRELIEHLNTIEGVEASYTPPVRIPEGIGAIVASPHTSTIRLVRVTTGPGKNWVQNSRGAVGADTRGVPWYTDAQVEHLINTSGYVILSEGVQP